MRLKLPITPYWICCTSVTGAKGRTKISSSARVPLQRLASLIVHVARQLLPKLPQKLGCFACHTQKKRCGRRTCRQRDASMQLCWHMGFSIDLARHRWISSLNVATPHTQRDDWLRLSTVWLAQPWMSHASPAYSRGSSPCKQLSPALPIALPPRAVRFARNSEVFLSDCAAQASCSAATASLACGGGDASTNPPLSRSKPCDSNHKVDRTAACA